jgi:hypothetical protein
MHILRLTSIIALSTLAVGLGSGCSKRTYIKTTPEGAEATLDDGRELGTTPILLEEDIWVWTRHTITFTKPGYKPTELTLNGKAQAANIAVCAIGACILWMGWPLCVAGKYRDSTYPVTMKRSANFDDYLGEESTGSTGRIDSSSPSISFQAQPRPR